MMSSESMPNHISGVFPHKMPLFNGTVASKGLSKPQNMSDLLGKQSLQYSGSYFAYDGRGKDRAQFTPPWSHSKASPLDGRSPVSHLSGMEGQSHVIYRQDSNSSEEGHSLSSSLPHAPVKQGFTIYAKSPEISSPTAAVSVAIRRQNSGGDNSSPPSENSVYLAIPKPMYGHNPCCSDLCCVMGPRYSVEHGSPRLSSAVYEHNWMQSEAHYADRPSVPRKAPEALLQQRGLQFEPGSETLKRVPVETYSQGRARTLPAMMEPSYSGYPCTPMTRALFGSLSEQCQRLQTSPRGYPGLYPSHPTYEHVTSEVYQEHSPMSKYGQLAQHPVFYYPQENVEVESRTQCNDMGSKRREDVPVILKHTLSAPRQHYMVPQPRQGEIPLPLVSSEKLSHHPLIRGFDYPCYAVPRFPLDASQIRSPLKRQHASSSLHPNHMTVPLSGQYVDCPIRSSNHLHQDKSGTHVNQSHSTSPFLRLDQTSPARRASQSGVAAASIYVNRYLPAFASVYRDRPVPSTAGLSKDRPLDYTSCEAQIHSQKRPKGLLVSPTALLPQSPVRVHTGPDTTNTRKIIYSPTVAPGSTHNGHVFSTDKTVPKGSLKRSISHSSAAVRVKEEDRDYCEVELMKKRQKTEVDGGHEENKPPSPPMPVIDNVFSLAPYQTYLQASGVLFPGRVPHKPVQSSEHCEGKTKADIKEKRPEQDEPRPAVCQASKEISASSPTGKPAPETFELKNIKVEKEDPADNTDNCAELHVSQRDCCRVAIKTEPEERASPTCEHMLVIKKFEPDELDSKPHPTCENEVSDEPKPDEATVDLNTSSQSETCTPPEQTVTPQYEPISPPQVPERRLDFKNIPSHCLKLPAYKLILCKANQPNPITPPEQPPAPPPPPPPPPLTALCQQKKEPQTPVRKHFLELHQSLHSLVSKSVAASTEEQLRGWLSKLDLSEPASPTTKVQKVSCLLGAKAREAWLTEEIRTALHVLLERLKEYTRQVHCPFPHVMRAGAVFLPMLVVKELLFPMVQGTFIDQVLQEHRVELRPTTLSEEKILIQLHKRACSSRLRRLMSLKHLPNVYADAINLLYYTCVCKHLGLDVDDLAIREKDEACEEPDGCRTPALCDIASSVPPPESQPQQRPTDQDTNSGLSRSRTKSRVKSSSRRMFLDSSLSDDEAEAAGLSLDAPGNKKHSQSEEAENGGSERTDSEQDSSPISPSTTSDTSWMCPLTSGDLSPSPSDPETKVSSGSRLQSSGATKSHCSGVILKLRRMFSKGLNRKKARYQAISVLETLADAPPSPQAEGGTGEADDKLEPPPRRSKPHRWQRTGGFSQALRPLRSSSKRNHRSLLKIKYCPYLSACHSAEHRRRWVLRSAVQRAQRAMRFYYPDLVGKRIRHLYEEDDKSEVWYRGEVLRVHEAHANPLKTIFEVRYDSEPEWKYYLELLIDYKKGWLKIEDEHRE